MKKLIILIFILSSPLVIASYPVILEDGESQIIEGHFFKLEKIDPNTHIIYLIIDNESYYTNNVGERFRVNGLIFKFAGLFDDDNYYTQKPRRAGFIIQNEQKEIQPIPTKISEQKILREDDFFNFENYDIELIKINKESAKIKVNSKLIELIKGEQIQEGNVTLELLGITKNQIDPNFNKVSINIFTYSEPKVIIADEVLLKQGIPYYFENKRFILKSIQEDKRNENIFYTTFYVGTDIIESKNKEPIIYDGILIEQIEIYDNELYGSKDRAFVRFERVAPSKEIENLEKTNILSSFNIKEKINESNKTDLKKGGFIIETPHEEINDKKDAKYFLKVIAYALFSWTNEL